MEAKYVCGFQGAGGKLFEKEEDAKESLRMEDLDDQIWKINEQIGELERKLGLWLQAELGKSSYNYTYGVSVHKITELVKTYPNAILHAAQRTLELNNKLIELKSLRNMTETDRPYGTNNSVFKRLKEFFSK